MSSKHDYFKKDCSGNEPEKIATHSNGIIFYRCKNCNYFGKIESFTKPFRAFEILQQH